MMKKHVRPGRMSVLAALALVALMALASTAEAKEPTKGFTIFKQCPRFTTGVNFCLFAQVKSGEVKIGTTVVPIVDTITLQGGYERDESVEPPVEHFFGALNGETLSKTGEPVPGGLAGLINCTEIKGEGLLEKAARELCKATFENKTTGVNAVTELAKSASSIGVNSDNLVNGKGVALSLPLKVKLENPLLGSECYIGSSSSPVTLNLTDGTTSPPLPNKPISGKVGVLNFLEEFEIIEVENNTLVDNAFSAPEATGCGGIFSFLIVPLVDAKLGLPSAAGKNTAIQNGVQKLATAESVIASEK